MKKYSMTCSCGDVMSLDAKSKKEAVMKFRGMMTAATIASHMQEKHPGQVVPAVADVHASIAKDVKLA